jgi:hypothetical protein
VGGDPQLGSPRRWPKHEGHVVNAGTHDCTAGPNAALYDQLSHRVLADSHRADDGYEYRHKTTPGRVNTGGGEKSRR